MSKKKRTQTISYNPDKKVTIRLEFDENEWENIKPSPVHRKDRTTYNLKEGWTHQIIEKLWINYRIPCPYSFKKHQFLVKTSHPYLIILGQCKECGNVIKGRVEHEPTVGSPVIFQIDTCETSDLAHQTNTYLANNRRVKAKQKLQNIKAKRYVDEQGANILNDSGTKPPYFVSESVAHAARQEAKDEKISVDKYSSDPITAILEEMNDHEAIREFSVDPVQVYYWLDNQTTLWNEAAKLNLPISIDATGSIARNLRVIDDEKSSAIFLYNITIKFSNHVYSVCQMLSSKHDAVTISEWLEAWIASGATVPDQVTADCSPALLISINSVFNECDYLEYNERCHRYIREFNKKLKEAKAKSEVIFIMINILPRCRVMRDRAHLLKSSCCWKCFKSGQKWTKKDMYVRGIAFAIEIEDPDELEKVIVALIVLCQAQYIDEGSNCQEQYKYLEQKISTFDHSELVGKKDYITCADKEYCLLCEFDEEEEIILQGSDGSIQTYLSELQITATKLIEDDKLKGYNIANPYWLPEILKNLLRLFKEYPSWTNITRKFYPHEISPVATSTASEVYFRIMKIDYELMCFSLQRLLLEHLTLLEGSTRNGRRELNLYKLQKQQDKIKGANRQTPQLVSNKNTAVEKLVSSDMAKASDMKHCVAPAACNNAIQSEVVLSDFSKVSDVKHCVVPVACSGGIQSNVVISKPRMLYQKKSIFQTINYHEIQRLFSINGGLGFKHDLYLSLYNYNLPYCLKDNECRLTLNAFVSLAGRKFLHGETIDSVMSVFKHRSEWQDVFYLPSTQINFILGDRCQTDHPDDWMMYRINFNFFGIVFMPFCYKSHWCLIMLHVRKKTIFYFDPYYKDTKERPLKALRTFFQRCREIMEKKTGSVEINNLAYIEWKETAVKNDRDLKNFPRQTDTFNCGCYIIYYMALLSGIVDIEHFEPNEYRLYIANLLLENFDKESRICCFCFNPKSFYKVKTCKNCSRWAHEECTDKWKSSFMTDLCDICY